MEQINSLHQNYGPCSIWVRQLYPSIISTGTDRIEVCTYVWMPPKSFKILDDHTTQSSRTLCVITFWRSLHPSRLAMFIEKKTNTRISLIAKESLTYDLGFISFYVATPVVLFQLLKKTLYRLTTPNLLLLNP